MAWLNLTMPKQTVRNGLKAKKIKQPHMNFFLQKQLIKFSCTYWSLLFCKIFKKILRLIQSYEAVPFSGPKWPICHEQTFLVQMIIITFIYLLTLFIVQNLKKFFQPCFFHSCLSTCQKSKSDINLLVKYWQLRNTEISMAESHLWL